MISPLELKVKEQVMMQGSWVSVLNRQTKHDSQSVESRIRGSRRAEGELPRMSKKASAGVGGSNLDILVPEQQALAPGCVGS